MGRVGRHKLLRHCPGGGGKGVQRMGNLAGDRHTRRHKEGESGVHKERRECIVVDARQWAQGGK